jgi:hypothetical protein
MKMKRILIYASILAHVVVLLSFGVALADVACPTATPFIGVPPKPSDTPVPPIETVMPTEPLPTYPPTMTDVPQYTETVSPLPSSTPQVTETVNPYPPPESTSTPNPYPISEPTPPDVPNVKHPKITPTLPVTGFFEDFSFSMWIITGCLLISVIILVRIFRRNEHL